MSATPGWTQRRMAQEPPGRRDYAIIGEIIESGAKVLDLGCGNGELLAWLKKEKTVEGRGVEIDRVQVQQAMARGVGVFQSDIEEAVRDYPDATFDYVILSQTLQETRSPVAVLREMLRVGRRAVVGFPNFGHWTVRLSHLWTGRSPRTNLFPYEWYNSPNIHFLTVMDFESLVREERWRVERRYFLGQGRVVHRLPNLMAELAVYLVTR